MTQKSYFWRQHTSWQGIGLSAVFATLLLLFLSFSVGLAAPQQGVTLQSLIGDSWLMIDGAVLESAASSGYSTVRNEAILGVERDMLFLDNGLRIEWDGDEGDPTSLDVSGLGGYDLTGKGFMDSIALTVNGINQPVQATLTVYSSENNASEYNIALNTVGQVVLPLSDFDAVLGSGVDFRDVGSIVLQIEGNTAGLSLGSLEMGSSLTAEREVVLVVDQNNNGAVDPNDIVQHNITIDNGSSNASAPLSIVEGVFGRTYGLVNGSVSAGQGQILSGNSSGQQVVHVALGSLAAGQSADISYQISMLSGPAISVTLIVQDGDTPPGSNGDPVSSLNAPFTNGNGDVGFTGGLAAPAGTENFVWFDTGITWRNSDGLPTVLTGAEGTMGVSDSGGFHYSPSTDGDDSVWTHNGVLQIENTPAPGFPPTTTNTFNSRPTMTGNGAAYWVSGFNETGGTSSQGRILYTSANAMSDTISVVIRSDDVISGFVVDRPSGVDFDYRASDDNNNLISVLLMDTGSTTDDGFVYVNGALVARETDPSGDGDNWDNFDVVSINNSGNYVYSGDTDGASTSDEFIAYNGATVIREGDTIGGVQLTSSANVNALSINHLGNGAYTWNIAGTEVLFVSCDMTDVANSTTALLSVNDMVDVDGNGTADATITDFNASTISGPGLDLAEDGMIYLEVDLDYGQGDLEAIIGLETGCAPSTGGPMIEVDPEGLVSIQPTDTQVDQTLTISNTGDADLTWSIDEIPTPADDSLKAGQSILIETGWGEVEFLIDGFCNTATQGDIPWISSNPNAGTTSAGTADDVTVSFDSTSIDLGVLRANLCVTNNSISSTIPVPVILEVPPAPSLILTKTVGLDPNSCSATDTVNIPSGNGGTNVTYCYTVQNSGNITLSIHNLVDDQLGVLLGPDDLFDIAPGATDFYTVSTLITQTTVNTGTWTAANSSGIHNDPAGDTFGVGSVQLDITEFQATSDAGTLTLQMVFSGTISPPGSGNPDDVAGFIDIDRDGSSLTGIPGFTSTFCPMPPMMGIDYFIDISSYNPGPGTMDLVFIDEFNQIAILVGSVNAAFVPDGFTIDIPHSLMEVLGPEEGIVDVAAVVGTTLAPTDCAPDGDVLTSRVDVSGSDTATVTQDNPTGVALSGLEGTTTAVWLPVWLMLLSLAAMVVPAIWLRFSGDRRK